ncbi:endochitinase A1 [Acyrthosiphon pisum]|uniref:Uncharacterized protein n=1 Tax=Acyrthosiphon pisum TaxID=7029 RepID=A0A8R2AAQ1_ACYPI|nr:endochitinase A1 [Acyrthosiphon pisum]|eukprot:XP_003243272.1 PREDICTED: endochitinase A1-like [Acyrthosiphon pisum]
MPFKGISVRGISVILASVAIVSNKVHCTPTCGVPGTDTVGSTTPFSTNLPVPSARSTLNAEMLDVLKNFHSSLPGQKTPAAETGATSSPLASDQISIMHFPAATGSADGATPNLMVPGVVHKRPFGPDMRMPDIGYNLQKAEPSMQSQGPVGNPLPVPPPAPAPATDRLHSSSVAISQSSRSPVPAQVKIEPASHNNYNQELIKLLTDMRISPISLQDPPATQGQNQMLANGHPTTHPAQTLPNLSPGASSSKDAQPFLGPNQTPLDYLLSSSHQLNTTPGYSKPSTDTNTAKPPPTTKPRLNYEFIKYLLTLPMYQQALYDLIKSQSSVPT